jgi:predicted Holliday junction resolvase-like endonuclease
MAAKKIDPIFTPRKLNPDDAKVIFHPIDYVVFNGMKNAKSIKNIVLLDREAREAGHRAVQRSIERVVGRSNYEWQTIRVLEDGKIKVE